MISRKEPPGLLAFRVLAAVSLVAVATYLSLILHLGYWQALHPTVAVHGAGYACLGLLPVLLLVVTCSVGAVRRRWVAVAALVLVGTVSVVGVTSGWIEWLGSQLA